MSIRSHLAIFCGTCKFRVLRPQKRTQAVACLCAGLSAKWGHIMLAIGMLATAMALVLGLRFSVNTLVLLTVAIAMMFAISVLGRSSPVVIALQMLATLASVQISYLIGSLLAAHFHARAKSASDRAQMGYLRGLFARTLAR